jgi:hypothetical protein
MRVSILGCLLAICLSARSGWSDEKLPVAGKSVSIEVLIAHVSQGGADAPAPTREQILELDKQGKVASLTRVQLTTLDLQTAMVQFGERTGVVAGRTSVPSGPNSSGRFANIVQTVEMGTIVEATPRVEDDGSVVLLLKIEQSRLIPAPDQAGGDKTEPSAFIPPKTVTSQCKNTLRVPAGKWIAIGGQRGEKEPSQTWILVSANVGDAKQ